MFVYQGKLKWFSYGQDETFVVVLPNGFARDGDTAYIFSQWTEDAQKRKKSNWFQTLIVSGLTKTSDGNDSFALKGVYYTWHIETQQVYGKLNVTMSNPRNDKSTMAVDRIWQSKGEQDTGNARIWTGKFNWLQFASDEPAILIVPDGFGDGKPILSIWQWTKDSKGQTKTPSFRDCIQKAEPGSGAGLYKFSYSSYYDITCTWNEKNEKLAVHMKEGNNLQQDVAQLNLSAKIERERPGHAHSFDAPLPAPEKVELEVRLPEAQSSLRRLLAPLPFPGTLIDTMEHTAAFLDQAGYLARYAQDRYAALDADYHLQLQLVEALQKENINLKEQIKTLTDALKVTNAKAGELQKQLDDAKAEAKNKEDELRNRIAELEKHDVQDHQIVEDLQKQLKDALDKIANLEAELNALLVEKKTLLAQIKTLQDTVTALQTDKIELENALKVQKDLVVGLKRANAELTEEKNVLEQEKNTLQGQLATAQSELAKTKDDLRDAQLEVQKQVLLLQSANAKLEERRKDINRLNNEALKTLQHDQKVQQRMDDLEDLLADNHINFDHIEQA